MGINDGGTFQLTMAPGKPVPGSSILDGTVGSGELGSSAVTSDKIAALAVVAGKIADAAIDQAKLANNAVTLAKIASGAVDSTKLADSAVTTAKIAGSAIDSTKPADNAATTAKITDGAVTGVKIGAGRRWQRNPADGAVGSTQLREQRRYLWQTRRRRGYGRQDRRWIGGRGQAQRSYALPVLGRADRCKLFSQHAHARPYIAWQDVHIQHKGTTYSIPNGNTNKAVCDLKYMIPTVSTGPTIPDAGPEDPLVFLNKNAPGHSAQDADRDGSLIVSDST